MQAKTANIPLAICLFVWMDILDTDTQRYKFEELTTYLSSTFYLQVESQEQMCRARKTIEAQYAWRAGSTYTGEPARADENMKEKYYNMYYVPVREATRDTTDLQNSTYF